MTAALEFQGVGLRIGDRAVLRDIDLRLDQRETLVLLGRSGAGKTTLLRMANRLQEPGSGTIQFEGRTLAEWDPIRLRRRMGYVIQDGGLFPHLSVARSVALVAELEAWPAQKITQRVDELLVVVGLAAKIRQLERG